MLNSRLIAATSVISFALLIAAPMASQTGPSVHPELLPEAGENAAVAQSAEADHNATRDAKPSDEKIKFAERFQSRLQERRRELLEDKVAEHVSKSHGDQRVQVAEKILERSSEAAMQKFLRYGKHGMRISFTLFDTKPIAPSTFYEIDVVEEIAEYEAEQDYQAILAQAEEKARIQKAIEDRAALMELERSIQRREQDDRFDRGGYRDRQSGRDYDAGETSQNFSRDFSNVG